MLENKDREKAYKLVKQLGKAKAYELATWILYKLEKERYCIWQTYDMEDLKTYMGRKPTDEELELMQENMRNSLEEITPEY